MAFNVGGGIGGGGILATTDIKIVKVLGDLPTPVLKDGVMTIILEDKQYKLNNNLDSAFPLAFPGTGKRSTWTTVNGSIYNYTGTDACFRDLDAAGDIEIEGQAEFHAFDGLMWDVEAVSGTWSFQAVTTSRFRNCRGLGRASGGSGSGSGGLNSFFGSLSGFHGGLELNNLLFSEKNTLFVNGNNAQDLDYDGQTVNFTIGETVTGGTSGATGVVQVDRDSGAAGALTLSGVSGVFQDDETLTGSSTGVAVVDGILKNMVIFTLSGASTSGSVNFIALTFFASANETLFDFKPEIESSVDSISLRGNQSENILNASAFAPGSLDPDSAKVFSVSNTFFRDTKASALLNFKGNSTLTVISAASSDGSNAVLVAGTWTCTKQSLFDCTTAGRVTYKGEVPVTVAVDVIATMDTTSADTVAAYIGLDGTPITATGISQLLEAGDRGTISTLWELVLNKDNFLEVFAENQTDATDIKVIDILFRSRS